MKKYIYPLALAATMITATACSDDEVVNDTPVIPEDQKGLIQLSMSDAGGVMSSSSMTRAGFTGGTSKNLETNIAALFSSTDGTSTRHSLTLMNASADASAINTDGTYNWASTSAVDYSGNAQKRYWDDAFGRLAILSVYAIAVPNKGTSLKNDNSTLENKFTLGSTSVSTSNPNWKTNAETTTISWKVTNEVAPASGQTAYTTQTLAILEDEDLCYSNNIQQTGKDGRFEWNGSSYPTYSYVAHTSSCSHANGEHDYYPNMTNGQMQFKLDNSSVTEGPGHFDHGHMIFKHAMTRITVDLKGGEGFDYANGGFTLQSQITNKPATIDLLKMNTSGTLDLKAGSWSSLTTSDHTYMYCGDKATGTGLTAGSIIYKLSAQVVPGNQIAKDDATNNFMTFNIDGNNYYVTAGQIFNALNTTENTTANEADGSKKVTVSSDNKITLEQGKNYHFTITIDKTKIQSLTCTLVDWVDVEASFPATNAYITFESLTTDVKDCKHFDLYRVLNLSHTITTPTNTTFDNTDNTLQYMTGYASNSNPVADKLSTDGTGAGVSVKTAGNTTDPKSTIWQTTWFFDNNRSFYHFRTVVPGTLITKEETDGVGDYFTMYSGPVKDDYPTSGTPEYPTSVIDGNETAKYNDYHWGAMFTPSTTAGFLNYNTSTGFKDQLTGPVGPTTSTLNLVEQHMMSNIKVILLTPLDDEGNELTNSVDLFKTGATNVVSKVSLTNFAGDAKVRMGNGLITPSTDYVTKTMTTPSYTAETGDATATNNYCQNKTFVFDGKTQKYYKTKEYTYRVVPQALTRDNSGTTEYVGITIQTPDENMYYAVEKLATIKPSKITGNTLKGDHNTSTEITRWYPGYTYTYYFTITKTGIQVLTCTIVDWVTVEAENIKIDLES